MNQYAETSANGGRLMLPICNRIITSEITNDYTLPDYQPEIRRVIAINENIAPVAKYISSDSVELDGNIDYTLLYVGADGALYSAPLSAEYSVSAPLSISAELDRSQAVTVIPKLCVENITARVTAPRKLTVRARLNCHVRAFGEAVFEELIEGEATPVSIQRLRSEAEYASAYFGVSELIEVSDEFDAEDSLRVVSADGDILINEVLSEADGASVSGEVLLKLLCLDEDSGEYKTIIRKMPFSEKVDTARAEKSAKERCARGLVSDITINVEEGKIGSKIGFFVEAEEVNNLPCSYTADLYSTKNHCSCRYDTEVIPVAISGISSSFSQSERIPLAETGVPEGAEIIDVYGKANVTGVRLEDGKCIMSGENKYLLVCKKGGEISMAELRAPFRYECDGGKTREIDRENVDIICQVYNCRCKADGDTLGIDSEIALSGMIFDTNEIKRVSRACMGEEIARSGSDVVICYPSVSETVWNVAKKYLVAPGDVIGNPETDRYCIIQM